MRILTGYAAAGFHSRPAPTLNCNQSHFWVLRHSFYQSVPGGKRQTIGPDRTGTLPFWTLTLATGLPIGHQKAFNTGMDHTPVSFAKRVAGWHCWGRPAESSE